MTVVFELKAKPNLPLEVGSLNPNLIQQMSVAEIGEQSIGIGNQHSIASEWFEISGNAEDGKVEFCGSLEQVHDIGKGMLNGEIVVHGNVGRHIGAAMSGGQISIHGNVDAFAGYEMKGGTIVVHGNASDHLGGCYPGASFGMNRGVILVAGSAGKGVGYRMRRGTIVVAGPCGEHLGWQMRAGTIMALGGCDGQIGIDMKRGSIVVGGEPVEPLATFEEGLNLASPTISMLQRWLSALAIRHQIELPLLDVSNLQSWHGDRLAGGRGELFAVCQPV